jgi:MraZ protein
MENGPQSPPPVPWPDGFHATRVDEKGRMRLPSNFLAVWEAEGKPELWVTTFDERIARIYFMQDWQQAKEQLQAKRGETSARQVLLCANLYGQTSTVDNQGRINLSTNLRRRLEFESQAVQLLGAGRRVDIYSDSELQQQMALARPNLERATADVESWGIG